MGLALGHAIKKSHLRTLVMHDSGLKDTACVSAISAGCAECSFLHSVSFKSNEIGPLAAEWVCQLLEQDTSITCLDMRSNILADQGTMSIAPTLANPTTHLTKLVLFDNRIRKAGSVALFTALKGNQYLKSLDVSANPIGCPISMETLKDMLTVNTTLESLFLWKIGLQDEGLIALSEGLSVNNALKRVELRSNTITVAGLLALRLEHILQKAYMTYLRLCYGSHSVYFRFFSQPSTKNQQVHIQSYG
eukprot:m.252612 g.252612  ORF g.252612 m.252612 type:complete len:248 (+) comp16155_c0_seq33:673-1416(+)